MNNLSVLGYDEPLAPTIWSLKVPVMNVIINQPSI